MRGMPDWGAAAAVAAWIMGRVSTVSIIGSDVGLKTAKDIGGQKRVRKPLADKSEDLVSGGKETLMFGEGFAVARQHALDHRALREVQEHTFSQLFRPLRRLGRVIHGRGDGSGQRLRIVRLDEGVGEWPEDFRDRKSVV